LLGTFCLFNLNSFPHLAIVYITGDNVSPNSVDGLTQKILSHIYLDNTRDEIKRMIMLDLEFYIVRRCSIRYKSKMT